MPDEVCAYFKDFGDYDYRPAREVADADENTEVRSVIDVDILGHIFEQSITDLERLRLSLEHPGPLQPGAPAESPSPALAGTLSPSEGERDGERRPPLAEGRATILPLLRGEGRGEGELGTRLGNGLRQIPRLPRLQRRVRSHEPSQCPSGQIIVFRRGA